MFQGGLVTHWAKFQILDALDGQKGLLTIGTFIHLDILPGLWIPDGNGRGSCLGALPLDVHKFLIMGTVAGNLVVHTPASDANVAFVSAIFVGAGEIVSVGRKCRCGREDTEERTYRDDLRFSGFQHSFISFDSTELIRSFEIRLIMSRLCSQHNFSIDRSMISGMGFAPCFSALKEGLKEVVERMKTPPGR